MYAPAPMPMSRFARDVDPPNAASRALGPHRRRLVRPILRRPAARRRRHRLAERTAALRSRSPRPRSTRPGRAADGGHGPSAHRVERSLGPTGTIRFTGSGIALLGTLGEACCEAGTRPRASSTVARRSTGPGSGRTSRAPASVFPARCSSPGAGRRPGATRSSSSRGSRTRRKAARFCTSGPI